MTIILIIIAGIILLLAFDRRLAVRGYTVYAERLNRPMRIALLADHHASRYGRDQERLLRAIHAREPDLILLAGDLFDDWRKPGETERLLAGLRQYPVYYAVGNHECRRADFAECKATAARLGVHVLTDETVTVQVCGETLLIGGIDDPEKRAHQDPDFDHGAAMDAAFSGVAEAPGYRILIGHRPDLIHRYRKYGFDLVVSGHAHGGQVRIPLLLPGGVFAPDQGFFPKWAGGVYSHGETTHVVSRGLSKTALPRVFNRPELVMVDLVPQRGEQRRI